LYLIEIVRRAEEKMEESPVNENVVNSGTGSTPAVSHAGWLVWLLGGISVSLFAMLSLTLLVLLIGSLALNVYLGWQLAGLEVTISQKAPAQPQMIVVTSTADAAIAATPEQAPAPNPYQPVPQVVATILPTFTATPIPAAVQVETQRATVAAIATQSAAPPETRPDAEAAFDPPTPAPDAGAISPQDSQQSPAAEVPARAPASDGVESAAVTSPPVPAESNNVYELIPLEGSREDRPAAEHGDHNLKLRDPTPIEVETRLVEIDGAGSDPNAPDFGKVFEPEIVRAYAIHGWDWEKNAKSELIQDGQAVLVGLKTTPGEDINIPHKDQDIFGGKFYATVLFADEDSLTFVYSRQGNVVNGYTVHMLGLQTDPNLVKLFNESEGNYLPGLTLDTPVGKATDELIVAIRDNGAFLDMRSVKDWWE
jgi:hypothetical protein